MATVAGGESMMTREQLLHLFSRFSFLTSLPEVKNRIADAVRDNQEAVAVTTEIQEEILREMGIDPSLGIGCLGKVNIVYENDIDLMIKFYQFVAKEEMAIDEAELEPREFAEKIQSTGITPAATEDVSSNEKIQSWEPSVILEILRKQLESTNFDTSASILTSEQILQGIRDLYWHSVFSPHYIANCCILPIYEATKCQPA